MTELMALPLLGVVVLYYYHGLMSTAITLGGFLPPLLIVQC